MREVPSLSCGAWDNSMLELLLVIESLLDSNVISV